MEPGGIKKGIEETMAETSIDRSYILETRRVHSAAEYRAMSEPILLEIQQREQEVLFNLSTTRAETSVG
jgi:hypothetical protein